MNPILLIVTTFITLRLSRSLLQKVVSLGMRKLYVTSIEDESLKNKLTELKAELATYNMIDDFAKHARCQRKIVAVVEQLKRAKDEQSSRDRKLSILIQYGLTVLEGLFVLGLIMSFWGTPLIQLPSEVTWPFSYFLSRGGSPGSVGVIFWTAVTFSGIKQIQNAVLLLLNSKPH